MIGMETDASPDRPGSEVGVLTAPSVAFRASFLAAMREFEESIGTADADGLSAAHLAVDQGFETYVRALNEGSLPCLRTHAGSYVRCFWWVVDGDFVGRISIRPDLTPGVRDANHIGYAIRPSRRGQGHGTAMLAAALPIAVELGVDPVVLVCAETNIGSRTVIERNGGHFVALHDGRCRYHIHAAKP